MLVWAIFFSLSVGAAEWPAANFKDCSFYKRVEEILGCGEKGHDYLSRYGFVYCREFQKESAAWSPAAKRWVRQTGQCLQEMLRDNRAKRLSPCSQMEDFAFDAHPICYKQYRFCDLELAEKYRVVSTIRVVDYLSRKSLAQTLNVTLHCLSGLISLEEGVVAVRLSQASERFNEHDRQVAAGLLRHAPVRDTKSRNEYFKKALALLTEEFPEQEGVSAPQMERIVQAMKLAAEAK